MRPVLNRRAALGSLGLGATVLTSRPVAAEPAPPSAATSPQGACILWPQAVEGPFYFDPKLVRPDIAEGRPGLPLALSIKVIALGSCAPLEKIRVDVWHADADGLYSGYGGQGPTRSVSTKGEHFLRGTQFTGADGRVAFTSIYPGWYPGRTPHIHVKAFLNETSLVTGQMYFPDDLSARVYGKVQPYAARPVPDTTNAKDGIFREGEREGGGIVLSVENETSGKISAGIVIAVDTTGQAARSAAGWGGRIRGWFGR